MDLNWTGGNMLTLIVLPSAFKFKTIDILVFCQVFHGISVLLIINFQKYLKFIYEYNTFSKGHVFLLESHAGLNYKYHNAMSITISAVMLLLEPCAVCFPSWMIICKSSEGRDRSMGKKSHTVNRHCCVTLLNQHPICGLQLWVWHKLGKTSFKPWHSYCFTFYSPEEKIHLLVIRTESLPLRLKLDLLSSYLSCLRLT